MSIIKSMDAGKSARALQRLEDLREGAVAAEQALRQGVIAALQAGASWTEIGVVLGLSARAVEREYNLEPLRQSESGRPRLWDTKEVAEYLGLQVNHVRELVSRRDLAAVRIGRVYRFDAADVDAFLKRHRTVDR